MSVEVGIVGLPNAGSTTLFRALTRAGAQVSGKEHVGMAPIPDPRLQQLAGVVHAKKVTPAAVRVVDVPGTGAALLGNLRQVDALLELLVADRDHVERRLERVAKQAKSGDPSVKAQQAVLEQILAHLDAGGALSDWPRELPPELEPLTSKPLLAVENGPGGIDAQLEAELAELPDEDAAATIHSDIARGFIRCEVIRWDDLVAAGSHADAARAGKQRLEGKTYVVEDGDVLNVRFNV